MRRIDRDVSGYVLPAGRGKAETAGADSPTSLLLTGGSLFALRAESPVRAGEWGRAGGTHSGMHGPRLAPLPQRKPEKALGLSIATLH